ncbi:MAG: signal peptidase I [Acidobacteria bacterium]|nr:MAG: signal peptidase I [Acidobacteriota bacterium]
MDSPNSEIVVPGQPEPPPIAVDTAEPGVSSPESASEEPATAAPQQHPAPSFAADIVSSVQSLIGTIVIAIFVITFVVQAFQIPSESMENTLLVGDYLLVDKLCYGGRGLGDHIMPYQKISRGDVIVFHYPVDPKQHFVKRVIGVPGDRLRMVNKTVYINGKPLTEPYVRFLEPPSNLFRDNFPRTDMPIIYGMEGKWWLEMRKLVEDGELIIPQGHYFVMGDNRDDSQDSRYWGFVPRENIIGRPLLIYWSIKTLDQDVPSGKAYRFAYALTHLFQNTRWNRTLRLVH